MAQDQSSKQQIIISGVGGQGVLFITGLLAQAAIDQGLPVFTSETHGMAQRGGTVVSHLKVGGFPSPLIRPGQADGLLALKTENIAQYRLYLKPEAWIVANGAAENPVVGNLSPFGVDAERLAQKIDNPRSANLVLLGFALACMPVLAAGQEKMFCTFEEIKTVLTKRLAGSTALRKAALGALEAGFDQRLSYPGRS